MSEYLRIINGRVHDPINGIDGEVREIAIAGGRIVESVPAGSKTIDAYQLRNLEASGRTEGIPHPGTVIVDSKGIIRAKLFHGGYKVRHEARDILEAAASID